MMMSCILCPVREIHFKNCKTIIYPISNINGNIFNKHLVRSLIKNNFALVYFKEIIK